MFVVLRRGFKICWDAYWRFAYNDGWAIASHIALSALLALFPFLIFVTALAGFLGTRELAEKVIQIMFAAWPASIVQPLELEVHNVLTNQRRDLLTLGAGLMLWFSSSGVEAIRVGLNRAYGVTETRWWFQTRAQSMLFVILGAIALLALAFLIVLAPALFKLAISLFPEIAREIGEVQDQIVTSRYAITIGILSIALLIAHLFLPGDSHSRRLLDVLPGIVATMAFWFVAAVAFAYYLSSFANYTTTYAGFASVMIALVFLYFISVIFILGGELNASIQRERRERLNLAGPSLMPIDHWGDHTTS